MYFLLFLLLSWFVAVRAIFILFIFIIIVAQLVEFASYCYALKKTLPLLVDSEAVVTGIIATVPSPAWLLPYTDAT